MFQRKIRGYLIVLPTRPSNRFKKYEVYKDGSYITAFGDVRYNHYRDRIGYYNNMDTLNRERRRLYRIRHAKDKGVVQNNPNFSGYWSWNYLWK